MSYCDILFPLPSSARVAPIGAIRRQEGGRSFDMKQSFTGLHLFLAQAGIAVAAGFFIWALL